MTCAVRTFFTGIEDINAAGASVPLTPRLAVVDNQLNCRTRWHTEYGGDAALAAIAADAIALITDPKKRQTLRRCANPNCSMLFLATNKRRMWCTANICGNRARVARHYERTRPTPTTE